MFLLQEPRQLKNTRIYIWLEANSEIQFFNKNLAVYVKVEQLIVK